MVTWCLDDDAEEAIAATRRWEGRRRRRCWEGGAGGGAARGGEAPVRVSGGMDCELAIGRLEAWSLPALETGGGGTRFGGGEFFFSLFFWSLLDFGPISLDFQIFFVHFMVSFCDFFLVFKIYSAVFYFQNQGVLSNDNEIGGSIEWIWLRIQILKLIYPGKLSWQISSFLCPGLSLRMFLQYNLSDKKLLLFDIQKQKWVKLFKFYQSVLYIKIDL